MFVDLQSMTRDEFILLMCPAAPSSKNATQSRQYGFIAAQ
ncbi:hypothetical protein DEMA109039_16740 [Deinococcus marmoris]